MATHTQVSFERLPRLSNPSDARVPLQRTRVAERMIAALNRGTQPARDLGAICAKHGWRAGTIDPREASEALFYAMTIASGRSGASVLAGLRALGFSKADLEANRLVYSLVTTAVARDNSELLKELRVGWGFAREDIAHFEHVVMRNAAAGGRAAALAELAKWQHREGASEPGLH